MNTCVTFLRSARDRRFMTFAMFLNWRNLGDTYVRTKLRLGRMLDVGGQVPKIPFQVIGEGWGAE